MFYTHLICFCALSVYYIKNVYGQYIGALPYPELNSYCKRMPVMLNDCNWCRCDAHQYQCQVRNCRANSDPFGAVNDALKEISVGMEGHGYWRSYNTHCAAHMQYQRGNLLCVCNERGEWPSASCRDAFRILYPIEQLIQELKPGDACAVNKLYLLGCNVCICPTDGQINSKYCTKRECTTLDEAINVKDSNFNPRNFTVDEIYTTCEKGVKLLVEGKECECFSGNRIICNEEDEEDPISEEVGVEMGTFKQIEVLDKNNDTAYGNKKKNDNDKEKGNDNDKGNNEKKKDKKEDDLIASVVFVKPPYTGVCPQNEFVKVACNYCFCMNDGNGICTTFKC